MDVDLSCPLDWAPLWSCHGTTLGYLVNAWSTCQTVKPGHRHRSLSSHFPLHHLLGLTSNFRWLVVMVTAREWGLFALFLLLSLKPCHYPYSTGPCAYMHAWLWVYFSVHLLVCPSLSESALLLDCSLLFSPVNLFSVLARSLTTSVSKYHAQLENYLHLHPLCSAPILQ